MSYFNFEDRYQDDEAVGRALSRFEGIVLSVLAHALLVLLVLFAPKLPFFQVSPEELARRQQELERILQRDKEERTLVFVQPRVDLKAAQPPPRAPLSDEDRKALTPVLPPKPTNPLPYNRGNSPEPAERAEAERARGPETPQPAQPEREEARVVPPANTGPVMPPDRPRAEARGGALGEALKNLQRYVQNETFNNPQGGKNEPGAAIQFDTKGVEFGPWLRRFVSRVRRNWFIPLAAQTMHGHVVLQFNIHKDGHITDIVVAQPSPLDSFNNAALNAIITSNPVDPLPPEYPSPVAAFTVTFYYNEEPPGN